MAVRPPMPAPQMIETPAMRRSAMLAKLLEEQRQPVEIKGGYGELAARLLGQGITQFSANRADKAVRQERQDRIANQSSAANLQLAKLLGDNNPPAAEPAAPMPSAMPEPSAVAPTAPAAPVGEVTGAALPPAMPAAMAPAPAPMPQTPPNPLGITPGEADLVRRALSSGDPGQISWAQGVLGEVEMRMAEPAASRQEFQSINGVPGVVDAVTRQWTPLEGGIPQQAMNVNQVVGANNAFGLPEGSGVSLNPFGVPSVVGRPTEGYERVGGQLRPEAGGREDLNAPTRRFAELTSLRKEVDPIIDSATLLQRNIQALRAGSRAQNGAGDIAMINGLQKLIDEGVVREGDVALQLQAQGINGGIAGLQGYLTSSGRFSPEIRAQLLATGEDIYENMNAVYRDRVLSYEPLVTETFGAGAFNNVLPSRTREAFGWGGGEAPAPRPQPRQRPAAPNRPRQPSANDDPLGLR